ncbi:MAG: hypothetical protein UU13_C0012G0020 [Candidatus Nomurabacteria bacterium GW2011_GWB1_40_7]|uniref:Uncharacterized protein n=1 Tax=Candidatus Nomurabacteria bacterium GW2011_GWB1_40_7 TaxID=1618744 RepID=A0A0G0SZK7_9BACT|nr:MAG: hypothetical protein UU13_C0012G0020 [Candidatus Nomurabacteria bacterium GW2011_GWB1_40_7]
MTIPTLIAKIGGILNSIIPVLIVLGMAYFIWGVIQYVIADSEEVKKKGKDSMIYGLIGLAVIFGMWGLVNIVVKTFFTSSADLVAPTLAPLTPSGACSLAGNPKFQDLLCYVTKIINDSVIPLIFALAMVFFVWGVVKFFIINAGEEAKRAEGKQYMIWGIVALAVMLSIWGLVAVLGTTFNLNTTILPQVKPPGASSPQCNYEGPCPSGQTVDPCTGTCL